MDKPDPLTRPLAALRQLGWPPDAIAREAALIRSLASQRQALATLLAAILS